MKMKKIVIFLVMVVIFFYGPLMPADETTDESTYKAGKEEPKKNEKITNTGKEPRFFKAVLQDQGKILSSPFRMKGKDFLLWRNKGTYY